MPRIRTIKPEFYRSPSTAKVSFPGRILYLAMWNWADDYGIGETNINGLLGFAFCDTDSVTAAEIPRLLTEVHSGYEVEFYEHHGRFYYQIVSWDSHQKTERRATRKNPTADDPDSVPDMRFHGSGGSSAQTLGKTPAGTGNRGTGEVGTGEGSSVTLGLGGPGGEPANLPVTAKAAPVSRGTRLPEAWMPKEDIIAHLLRRFPAVDLKLEHEKFTNHFSSQPGAKGRKTNWDRTFVNWIIRTAEQSRPAQNGASPHTQTAYDRKKDHNRTVHDALGADQPKELTS